MPEAVAKRKPGRPRVYTPQDFQNILDAASRDSISIVKACMNAGINRMTLYRALQNSDPAFAHLKHQYALALTLRAEWLAEEALHQSTPTPGMDSAAVNAQRLYVDTLKWAAGKLAPKTYGDYAGKGPETVNVTVETLHLTALKQLQAPIEDAAIIPDE